MTTADLAISRAITNEQADAAVAAWFGIGKSVPVDHDVRHRMRQAIIAAVGDVLQRHPIFEPETTVAEDLLNVLRRAEQEGQLVTVELVSVPPLAMGRVVMLGTTRAASASTLAFRAEETVDSEAGPEYSSEEREQTLEWVRGPR